MIPNDYVFSYEGRLISLVEKQWKNLFFEKFTFISQHRLFWGLHTYSRGIPIFSSLHKSKISRGLRYTHWIPEKWSPGKMVPGKIVPEENGPPENWSPGNSKKNRGMSIEHRGVCVEFSDVISLWKPKTRKQTQNLETNNRGVSVEHRGVCVYVECANVINLWNPKTRQQKFLDSFRQFGAYVGSWRKRQTSFCVCSGINR